MSAKNLGNFSKTNFYHSNGSGRDQYIAINSGGLTAENQRANLPKSGTFLKTHTNKTTTLYKPSNYQKFVHYHSNGSGRDNYIIHGSGGFINTASQSNFFRNSLRSSQNNFFNERKQYQYNPSKQMYANQERTVARVQRIQSARLSRPRNIAVPFSHYVDKAITKQQKKNISNQQDKDIYSGYC